MSSLMAWITEVRMNRKHHVKIKNQSWITQSSKRKRGTERQGAKKMVSCS